MKTILTIAGHDPSGGAGVAADLKTFAAFGCYGIAAITSLTFQNTVEVRGASHSSAEVLEGQLAPLLDDFSPTAVKTGMIPTPETIRVAAAAITRHQLRQVVVDPVIRSTSGFDLIDDRAVSELIAHLLPLATLITPNLAEAERLTGGRVRTLEERKRAGAQIHELARQGSNRPGPAVLLKGGHLPDDASDLLFDGRSWTLFPGERIETRHTHGTGCTLSAAIAALLGSGQALAEAIAKAKDYVTEAIRTAPGLGHGAGPLNHLVNPWILPAGRPAHHLKELATEDPFSSSSKRSPEQSRG
ncbi:MAG: bifunctional hydroxymethylpyrimidine kinase/phosphomethylpyrimidine kinase [Blastocatellia bacterium]